MKKLLARYPIGNPRHLWKQDNFIQSVVQPGPMGLEHNGPLACEKARRGMQTAVDAGFNIVELLWASSEVGLEMVRMAERLNIPLIYQNMLRFGGMGNRKENLSPEENNPESVIRDLAPWKSVFGLCVFDEPMHTEQRTLTKELIRRVEEACPQMLPFACIDAGNIDKMADEVDPVQLSFDQYPFGGWAGAGMSTETQMDKCTSYWDQMEIAYKAAKRIDAPFWFYYQGHKLHYNPCFDDFSFAAARMMANSALLYGAKGVSCYIECDGFMDSDTCKRGIYFEEQKKLNREISMLGNTLMALDCKRVIHDETVLAGEIPLCTMDDSELLTGKLPPHISVSELKDAYGNDYLMVLNRDYKNEALYYLTMKEDMRAWRVSAEDGEQRLAFDDSRRHISGILKPGCIALYRLQPKSEEPYAIEYYLEKGSF